MVNLQGINRRIKSAKNITQITKAMEMVSASKMKKAQEQALSARPFTEKLEEMIRTVTFQLPDYKHPLLTEKNQEKNIAVIIVATNKGLCGGINVNLFRELTKWANDKDPDTNFQLITIGKKAKKSIPGKNSKLIARFNDIEENPSFEETRAIAGLAIDEYTKGAYDAVYVIYPKFISTIRSDNIIKRLLPIKKDNLEEVSKVNAKYSIEPNAEAVLDELIVYQIEMSLYHIVLESRASEHSARMVAMKNASDNARDLINDLTLEYNQARQSHVTNELLDATSALMALED